MSWLCKWGIITNYPFVSQTYIWSNCVNNIASWRAFISTDTCFFPSICEGNISLSIALEYSLFCLASDRSSRVDFYKKVLNTIVLLLTMHAAIILLAINKIIINTIYLSYFKWLFQTFRICVVTFPSFLQCYSLWECHPLVLLYTTSNESTYNNEWLFWWLLRAWMN